MGQKDCILYCVGCDSKICEVTKYKTDKKGMVIVPGVVNTVVVTDIEDKDCKNLVCSCGETLGEAVIMKSGWKYYLNSKKITRSTIHDSKKEVGQSQEQLSSSDKQASNRKKSKESSCGCEKNAEFLEMKNRLEKLELQMNTMKTDNMSKFKDMSKMLIMYKLEILRLQDIIWSLHPNIDLKSAFILDNTNILMALKGIRDVSEEDIDSGSVASGC